MSNSDRSNISAVYDLLFSHRDMLTHRSFSSYVYAVFRSATLYRVWQTLLLHFRRFRLLAWILRISALLLAIVETGAMVVLTTAVFLVLLPVLLFWTLGILLTATIESRRQNRTMLRETEGKRIYVLFMTARENPFLPVNARALANSENNAVIIVSPFLLSSRGVWNSRFYNTVKKESSGIFLVRKYYFFSLKKHVLDMRDTAYLY